jgi:hypothetical protein
MKRMVVDKNMLEDPENLGPKHPLRAWLAASKDHIAVVTDYAQLEMLKGNALKNILKSTEILVEFPKQVHILKPITTVSSLKGKKKALKKRLSSGGATRAFRKWCGTRARAVAGDARFAEKIVKRGEQATLQLADIFTNMAGFAENILDATTAFTDDELGTLRRHEPITDAIVLKILDGTLRLAETFFLLHPDRKKPPAIYDVPYTFIFRFALCALLHALHWRVRGGAEDRLAERMRNDVIDVTYAAYALCFDGLLSEDKMVREIYDNAQAMLALFTKHAPKPPHRRSKRVDGNVGGDAPRLIAS